MSAPGSMAAKVDKYIQQQRALGWQLTVEARELARFAAYADSVGNQGPLTIELALGWARLADNRSRFYQARRLKTVGTFVRHLAAFEPGTAIPSRGLLGPAHQRVRPYIYSDREIIRLMEEASQLSFLDGLPGLTYRTLIGLLASTGLRVCEALRLDRGDLNTEAGIPYGQGYEIPYVAARAAPRIGDHCPRKLCERTGQTHCTSHLTAILPLDKRQATPSFSGPIYLCQAQKERGL